MKIDTLVVEDSHGYEYDFGLYSKDTQFKNVSAIYIFVKLQNGEYNPLYIGQSTELGTRLSNHEKKAELVRAGFTHYLVRQFDESQLDEKEKSFIQQYSPEFNTQHNTL